MPDPWAGPIARTRFARTFREGIVESPFYLGAQRAERRFRGAGRAS